MVNPKGFVFSLDAMLAVVILIIALIAVYFLSAEAKLDSFSQIVLKKQADDLLISLDKVGDLATLNSTFINNSINNTVSSSLQWKMDINYYNYSNNSNGFVLAGSLSFQKNASSGTSSVTSQREFIVFQNNRISNYGTARLTLWAK